MEAKRLAEKTPEKDKKFGIRPIKARSLVSSGASMNVDHSGHAASDSADQISISSETK